LNFEFLVFVYKVFCLDERALESISHTKYYVQGLSYLT